MAEYEIKGWHIHVYFDEGTRAEAKRVREAVAAHFPSVAIGRWHEKAVGPHPSWSYQIAFGQNDFAELVPFVARSREGLSVLLHALTGDDMRDHTDLAMWMGASRDLVLSALE